MEPETQQAAEARALLRERLGGIFEAMGATEAAGLDPQAELFAAIGELAAEHGAELPPVLQMML